MTHSKDFAENVLINNFGQLVRKDLEDLRIYKAKLIKSIMLARHKMRYEFDMVIFDRISDMDIDELERINMDYDEQLIRYGK